MTARALPRSLEDLRGRRAARWDVLVVGYVSRFARDLRTPSNHTYSAPKVSKNLDAG